MFVWRLGNNLLTLPRLMCNQMQRNNENSLKITANILGGSDYFVSKHSLIESRAISARVGEKSLTRALMACV
jgi:hypothetical protein